MSSDVYVFAAGSRKRFKLWKASWLPSQPRWIQWCDLSWTDERTRNGWWQGPRLQQWMRTNKGPFWVMGENCVGQVPCITEDFTDPWQPLPVGWTDEDVGNHPDCGRGP